jgi:hypothetical protein
MQCSGVCCGGHEKKNLGILFHLCYYYHSLSTLQDANSYTLFILMFTFIFLSLIHWLFYLDFIIY